ncbi:Cof-type HAD-IIB family hydrolase [Brevibacillus humidisoli]|uniref:Cof-type HAD-IIB family hydrolase n=1 Tax=Brevibacillus humidisoli TaxID=2895522 RepID=UPI001E4D2BE1|nr:Cof-type HAD-IIB family hydrolase [Brevibacillus humidisoli]UFJ39098.1 Cof-type HAD-IIB family hydrolase [Brevibacillus humidisoli]
MNNKDIKLVAIDIDGTLLDRDSQLHQDTVDTLQAVRKAGIQVVLASGRTYRSTAMIAEQVGLEIPIVAYNGAFVARPGEEQPLWKRPLPLTKAQMFLREAEAMGCYVKVYVDDHLYVQAATEETIRFSAIHQVDYTEVGVGQLSRIDVAPMKIVIIDEPERIDQLYHRFQHWTAIFSMIRDSPRGIEIVHKGVNKSIGIGKLLPLMGLTWVQIMAIGNEQNDLEMVTAAAVGVAMGNASTRLKQEADVITLSNDEQGVARVLQQMLLLGRG